MKAVRISKCAFAIALVTACGAGDPPETIRYGRGNTGARGPGAVSGTGGGSNISPPPSGGGATGKGSGPSAEPVGLFEEAVEESDPAPLPISGGTLAIIAQGTRAAIADPDNDQVVVVDLESMKVSSVIPLAIGDDPGRLVEDAAGRLHVALRAGRGVAVIEPIAGVPLGRLPVCLHPRGLAYDYFSDTVHVACAGGELVSYTAATGLLSRSVRLDRDLRDVVVDGERLLVSRFRAAELLVVEPDGSVSDRIVPRTATGQRGPTTPAVAWRTIAAPGGGALMVHQMIAGTPISVSAGGYGNGKQCGKIVTTAVSWLRSNRTGWFVDGVPTVLPVDVATNGEMTHVAVASAARSARLTFNASTQYFVFTPPPPNVRINLSPCGAPPSGMPPFVEGAPEPEGWVVAVAYDPIGRLAMQTRAPAVFHLGDREVQLPGRTRRHTGHELFHLATAAGIACATCHPEGRDDGQVWNFATLGPLRTQSLAGGVAGTEPFHWAGDMHTFETLAADVFRSRMSGPVIQPAHVTSLKNWIEKIPAMEVPPPSDADAALRGQILFNDGTVGCATCHSGARLTNNQSMIVNTGGLFQVPSLRGLVWRAPYMHQGCAKTLDDRFGTCGGGDSHGQTSHLTVEQRADLVAYLETL